MAKRDETPIRFEIQSPRPIKGPIIPIPVNQPHWRYKYAEYPPRLNPGGWISVGLSLLCWLGVVLFVYLFVEKINQPAQNYLFLVFPISLFALGLINMFFAFRQQPVDDEQPPKSARASAKKLPKRRKDYH